MLLMFIAEGVFPRFSDTESQQLWRIPSPDNTGVPPGQRQSAIPRYPPVAANELIESLLPLGNST